MLPQRESLPAVTAAGIVAIIFASFGILGTALMELVVWVNPDFTPSQNRSAMPPELRPILAIVYLLFLGVSICQLIVGIQILRRRNWARIAMLVWAVFMAAFCVVIIAVMMFAFSMPLPQPSDARDIGPVLIFVKLFVLLFYSVPLAVGIWWLILFTRPRVIAAFQSSKAYATTAPLDASGFPTPSFPVAPSSPRKPTIPIPIAIVAALDASGAVSLVLALFIPLPFQPPSFLFGIHIQNLPYKIILALIGIAYAVFVVGIFKLKRWGLDSLIAVKSLFLLSSIVTLFNPKFMEAMDEMMRSVVARYSAFPGRPPFFSHSFQEAMYGFSYALGVALVAVMLIYRARFLKAAAEAGR
jgi:hypothetical protein